MQVNDALTPLAERSACSAKTAVGGTAYDKQIHASAPRRRHPGRDARPSRRPDRAGRAAPSTRSRSPCSTRPTRWPTWASCPTSPRCSSRRPKHGQRLLFSATLDGDVDTLVRRFLHDPVTHSVDAGQRLACPPWTTTLLLIPPREKIDVIAAIAPARAARSCSSAPSSAVDRLAEQLAAVGVRAGALHGGKTQRVRTRTLAEFREGRVNVLVATDVAARGIHVDGVSLVVHVDPPKDAKDYLHRAGRTARAGESGTVATLVLPRQRRSTLTDARAGRCHAGAHRGHASARAELWPRSPAPVRRAASRSASKSRRPPVVAVATATVIVAATVTGPPGRTAPSTATVATTVRRPVTAGRRTVRRETVRRPTVRQWTDRVQRRTGPAPTARGATVDVTTGRVPTVRSCTAKTEARALSVGSLY